MIYKKLEPLVLVPELDMSSLKLRQYQSVMLHYEEKLTKNIRPTDVLQIPYFLKIDIRKFDIFRWGRYLKNFKFYVLNVREDII